MEVSKYCWNSAAYLPDFVAVDRMFTNQTDEET